MKAIFLTSNVGSTKTVDGKKVVTTLNNENKFVDNLKKFIGKDIKLCWIASNPDGFEKTKTYANYFAESLKLDGINVAGLSILDHSFDGNIKETVLNSDIVFLSGGHTPTQNKYFNEIGLKEILKSYNGVVIGQSAGTINLADECYIQPDNEQEFHDSYFPKTIDGLGFVSFKVYPHMNRAKIDQIDGISTFDLCLKDSKMFDIFGMTDGGYILVQDDKAVAFGETLLFQNGSVKKILENGQSKDITSLAQCKQK
ncbi:MAG: Type 1 glutamine amidotransferase-like domain-containing protein [Clostridia bacterium]|nr:Type 1 glutamine amidotransferase-like domain-containing protein [Clostridia bacterium]